MIFEHPETGLLIRVVVKKFEPTEHNLDMLGQPVDLRTEAGQPVEPWNEDDYRAYAEHGRLQRIAVPTYRGRLKLIRFNGRKRP